MGPGWIEKKIGTGRTWDSQETGSFCEVEEMYYIKDIYGQEEKSERRVLLFKMSEVKVLLSDNKI